MEDDEVESDQGPTPDETGSPLMSKASKSIKPIMAISPYQKKQSGKTKCATSGTTQTVTRNCEMSVSDSFIQESIEK